MAKPTSGKKLWDDYFFEIYTVADNDADGNPNFRKWHDENVGKMEKDGKVKVRLQEGVRWMAYQLAMAIKETKELEGEELEEATDSMLKVERYAADYKKQFGVAPAP